MNLLPLFFNNVRAGGRRKRAATLLEVLVVVAIIVILAGLYFPVSRMMFGYGKRIHCLSKAKDQAHAQVDFNSSYGGRVAYSTPTVFNWQDGKTWSLNDLDWVLLICARGMGMGLDSIKPGMHWEAEGYFWNWEYRNSGMGSALPGDRWEWTYNPENYNDGSSADEDVEESKAGLPPGYGSHGHSYFYQTHHQVAWRCFCIDAPKSAYLAQSFSQEKFFYEDLKGRERQGWPIDFIMATHTMTYAANMNLPKTVQDRKLEPYTKDKVTVRTLCTVDNKGRELPKAVDRVMLNITQIPSPSKRCFSAEMMESYVVIYNSGDEKLNFPAGTPLNNVSGSGSGMPGYAAAGQGKENYERYGDNFTSGNWDDDSIIEENRRQIKEGRHGGYVLHTYFDGSARAISADAVGRRQLKPGKKIESVTDGPYGLILAPDSE